MRTLVLLLAAAGSMASAQDGDRRDYGRPLDTAENRADMSLRIAARCSVMKVPSSARKVLEAPVGSAEEAKRAKGLPGVARECFQPQWPAFPATAMRNAIAEVTYRQAHQQLPTIANTAAPASFGVVPDAQHGTSIQEAAWGLAAIANCAVFTSPTEAHRWIVGPRNVDEELRRFDAMKPAIVRCAPGQAATMLTARNFRGPVANALLARATAAEKK